MASITEVKSTVKGKAPKFRAQVRRKGQKTLSKSFATRADAIAWGKTQEAKVVLGQVEEHTEANKITLTELIAMYVEDTKANTKRQNQLKWWENEIGYMFLSDIKSSTIKSLGRKLAKSPKCKSDNARTPIPGTVLSPATVNRYTSAISAVFKYANEERDLMSDNPARVKRKTEAKHIERFLDDEEREALLTACADSEWPGLLPMVWIALCTGARRSNVLNLKWSDIDLKRGEATVTDTKNGDTIVLPLMGKAMVELKKWAKVRDIRSKLVFPSKKKPSVPYFASYTHWVKAVDKADLKAGFRFHDLRHTTGSYLAQNGANQATIMAVMGHKTLAASQRYMHLNTEHKRAALEKVFGS